nr:YibE/F family protein [uncultured Dethiosulfovibrio sp.]
MKKTLKTTGAMVLAAVLAWSVGVGVGNIVIKTWDYEDSWVVRLEAVRLSPVQEESDEGWLLQSFDLLVTFLSGESAGDSGSITVEQLEESHLKLNSGRSYILMADRFPDGVVQYSVTDRFRLPWVISFLLFSVLSVCIIAGWTGARAVMGLGISLLVLVKGFVPAVLAGYPPVPCAMVALAVLSAVTIFLVVRRPHCRPVAFLGAMGGAVAAYTMGASANWLWQLTGLGSDGATLFASTFPGYDMRGIFLASVMVGSIGAVLDVAISVTSSMAELADYDPSIPKPRLWKAGTSVGREILGSMINTLILAYFGTSLVMTMMMVNARPSFAFLFNDPIVSQELVQSLAGTIGLLLTVPMTTLAGLWLMKIKTTDG